MSIQPGNLDPNQFSNPPGSCGCDGDDCTCDKINPLTQHDKYIQSVTGDNAPRVVEKSQPWESFPDSHRQFLM